MIISMVALGRVRALRTRLCCFFRSTAPNTLAFQLIISSSMNHLLAAPISSDISLESPRRRSSRRPRRRGVSLSPVQPIPRAFPIRISRHSAPFLPKQRKVESEFSRLACHDVVCLITQVCNLAINFRVLKLLPRIFGGHTLLNLLSALLSVSRA